MKDITKAHIAILIVNIIFGLNIPIAKKALGVFDFDPLALSFLRMSGAAIIFWIASLFIKTKRIEKKHILTLILAALFGISINQISFIVGLKTTSPIDASLIITLTPIITMLISALYLREPITTKKFIGVFIGFIGAILLILSSNSLGNGSRSFLGNALVFTSSFSYALYLVFFKKFISTYHPIEIMKWMFLISSIIILPFTFNSVQGAMSGEFPLELILRISYVIIGATFTTYLLIPIGQKNLRPTTLSMYNYLQPIIAAVVTVFFTSEVFGYQKIISTILVFMGVYIVTQSKSRAQLEEEKRLKAEAQSSKKK